MPAGFNKALSECSGEAIIMVGGHCTLHQKFHCTMCKIFLLPMLIVLGSFK